MSKKRAGRESAPAGSALFRLLDQQLYRLPFLSFVTYLPGIELLTLPQKAASLANASLPSFISDFTSFLVGYKFKISIELVGSNRSLILD